MGLGDAATTGLGDFFGDATGFALAGECAGKLKCEAAYSLAFLCSSAISTTTGEVAAATAAAAGFAFLAVDLPAGFAAGGKHRVARSGRRASCQRLGGCHGQVVGEVDGDTASRDFRPQ